MGGMRKANNNTGLIELLEQVSELSLYTDLMQASSMHTKTLQTPQVRPRLNPRILPCGGSTYTTPQNKRKPHLPFTPTSQLTSHTSTRKKVRSNSFLLSNAPRLPSSPELSCEREVVHEPHFSPVFRATRVHSTLPSLNPTAETPHLHRRETRELPPPPPMPMFGSSPPPTERKISPSLLKMRKADNLFLSC
jgi:hypothetical protein